MTKRKPSEPKIVREREVVVRGVVFLRQMWSDNRVSLCPAKFRDFYKASYALKKDENHRST